MQMNNYFRNLWPYSILISKGEILKIPCKLQIPGNRSVPCSLPCVLVRERPGRGSHHARVLALEQGGDIDAEVRAVRLDQRPDPLLRRRVERQGPAKTSRGSPGSSVGDRPETHRTISVHATMTGPRDDSSSRPSRGPGTEKTSTTGRTVHCHWR